MCSQQVIELNRLLSQANRTSDSETVPRATEAPTPEKDARYLAQQPCWKRRAGCLCRCHKMSERSGLFLSLTIYGLTAAGQSCNRLNCTTRRYSVCFRLALTQLGIPLAIRYGLALEFSGFSRLRLYPTPEAQRVCKYLSPGFKLMIEMQNNHAIHFPGIGITDKLAAHDQLLVQNLAGIKRLFATGEASSLDVDPAGHTWVEVRFGSFRSDPDRSH